MEGKELHQDSGGSSTTGCKRNDGNKHGDTSMKVLSE